MSSLFSKPFPSQPSTLQGPARLEVETQAFANSGQATIQTHITPSKSSGTLLFTGGGKIKVPAEQEPSTMGTGFDEDVCLSIGSIARTRHEEAQSQGVSP